LTYVDQVSRAWLFASRYGLDLLIVIAAVESAISTALRDDPGHPTGPMLWFEVLAVAAVVLALLGRRRFPFAAPAVTWLFSAALSFADGLLIVNKAGLFVAGMGAALLLGNLRRDTQARVGLAIVVSGAAIVIYNDPNHVTGDLIFGPVLFAIGWLVGFARYGREPSRPRPPRSARLGPRESGRRRLALRWPRSADGSRESSIMSSHTASA